MTEMIIIVFLWVLEIIFFCTLLFRTMLPYVLLYLNSRCCELAELKKAERRCHLLTGFLGKADFFSLGMLWISYNRYITNYRMPYWLHLYCALFFLMLSNQLLGYQAFMASTFCRSNLPLALWSFSVTIIYVYTHTMNKVFIHRRGGETDCDQ